MFDEFSVAESVPVTEIDPPGARKSSFSNNPVDESSANDKLQLSFAALAIFKIRTKIAKQYRKTFIMICYKKQER